MNRSIERDHDEEMEELKNSYDEKVMLAVVCVCVGGILEIDT